jgi:mRNA interferase MazF
MGTLVKGDIVVVPFPFSNLYSSKKRPALVLADSGDNDIILCRITSQNIKDDKAVQIELSDVENGSLRQISNARPNKLFTADRSIISYKLGNLSLSKMENVTKTIIQILAE